MALSTLQRTIVKAPKTVRDILLSDADIELYTYIKGKRKPVSATEVKQVFNITLQNAGSRLGRLYSRGYVDKSQKPLPTGGYCNVYTALK